MSHLTRVLCCHTGTVVAMAKWTNDLVHSVHAPEVQSQDAGSSHVISIKSIKINQIRSNQIIHVHCVYTCVQYQEKNFFWGEGRYRFSMVCSEGH